MCHKLSGLARKALKKLACFTPGIVKLRGTGFNGLMSKKNKYFGTDGIRGTANQFPMTPELALKAAMATAIVLRDARNGGHIDPAVLCQDTRRFFYLLAQAISAGVLGLGVGGCPLWVLPRRAVWRGGGKGLCRVCGTDRNAERCACVESSGDDRFAIVRSLLQEEP